MKAQQSWDVDTVDIRRPKTPHRPPQPRGLRAITPRRPGVAVITLAIFGLGISAISGDRRQSRSSANATAKSSKLKAPPRRATLRPQRQWNAIDQRPERTVSRHPQPDPRKAANRTTAPTDPEPPTEPVEEPLRFTEPAPTTSTAPPTAPVAEFGM